jgi:hypothetical protein
MKKRSKTIAFRVPEEHFKILTQKAKEFGISPGAYARCILIDALLSESTLLEELREQTERQMRLERHLKLATVALLVDAGKAGVEDAEAFVRDNLS